MTCVWLAFLGGVMAFPHCVGMCGGFALHFAGGDSRSRWSSLGRQLGWHAGRLTTYAFLGGLAGFWGHRVSLLEWPAVRESAGFLTGAVTILMGLRMLGLPWRLWRGHLPCRGRPARVSRGRLALADVAFRKDVPHGQTAAGPIQTSRKPSCSPSS